MSTVRIQLRRGTVSEWSTANPILAAGEVGFETDTNKMKVGDGSTHWNSLDYITAEADTASLGGQIASDIANAVATAEDYADQAAIAARDAAVASSQEIVDALTTSDIAEGSNLYYTNNRAKDAVGNASFAGYGLGKSYDSGSHELTFFSKVRAINNLKSSVSQDGHVDFEIESDPTITGSVTSDSLTTGPITATHIQADSLLLSGDLYVSGTTTSIDTASVEIADPMIYMGADNPANLVDLGFVASFTGTEYQHTGLVRDASSNTWVLFKGVTDEPTTTVNFTQGSLDDLKLHNLDAATAKIGDVTNTEIQRLSNVQSNIQDQIDARGYATDGIFNNSTMHDLNIASLASALPGDIIDTEQLVNGSVEYNKLNSSVQDTLDSVSTKAPLESPTFTGSVVLPTSTAIGNVSSTELGYVDGVTSSIQTQLDSKASVTDMNAKASSSSLTSHTDATTSVHGIADTAALATKTYVDNAGSSLQTNIDAKAPIASPTFTGTVSGITKSMVGLGNVDNTSDANKPVSTATQTALDLKAPKANPTFTGTINAVDLVLSGNLDVEGAITTTNTSTISVTDPMIYVASNNSSNTVDLGIVGAYNDGTHKHSGLVRDASDNKWKLFTGVTSEPTTTVDFTQGSMDALKVGALEATTVTPSSGVVFSDGTQTHEGVISRTPIVHKTASYTLSALTERDSLVEVSSSSGVTLTVPADADLNYPVGTSIDILQTNTGQVTVAGASGVTVNATPGLKLRTQWSGATLFKRAADTWVLYGDLSA